MLAPPPVDPQYKFLRSIVDSYPCPAIVTSTEGIVTFLNHAASQLWGRSEAELLGKRLASLQLPGLNPDLLVEQTARVRAGRSERELADGVMEASGGEPVTLRAQVVPLRGNGKDMQGLLYVAHDVTPLRSLEQNLQRANAELQAANLAELDTTNRELAHRTQEMDALSFSQRTIIRTLTAGVLVLDPHGRITTWNLAAERLLGLTEREAVGQVLWTLNIPALNRSLLKRIRKHVTENRSLRLEEVGYQLPHGGRGRATLVATPLIMDSQVLGSILLFEDTTRLAALAEENRTLKERLKA